MRKLKDLKTLINIILRQKRAGKKIVFTNGCFDVIHAGHIKVFNQAKAKGDILILGLNSDASIRRIKGPERPIVDQASRAAVLAALEPIDFIVLFDQDTPYETIKALRPDYLVKGGDWDKTKIIGAQLVKKVFRVKLVKNLSTTSIIKKIVKAYGPK